MTYAELVIALNSPNIGENLGKELIVNYLSQDEKIIPIMLKILSYERSQKKEMIEGLNLNNSRNLLGLISYSGNKKEDVKQREFFIKETKDFYNKNEDKIRCCFKIEGINR